MSNADGQVIGMAWEWVRRNSGVLILIAAMIGFVVQAEVRIAGIEARIQAMEIQADSLSRWRSGVDVDIATIKAQIENIDSTTKETRSDVKRLLEKLR